MELVIEKKAHKALLKMQPKRAATLADRLDAIAANPFARHANVESITGAKDGFRLRTADWRAVYWIDRHNEVMVVQTIKPRGDVYKRKS